MSSTDDALPQLALDSATLGDLDADLSREWLVTNGLGGYALGTIGGATTRSYSGLLVAALDGPQQRVVLVTKVDEDVALANGAKIALGTNEYADGTIDPHGYERLVGFALDGSIPTFTYRLGDDASDSATGSTGSTGPTLIKRVWMEHGANITYLQYRYMAGSGDGNGTDGQPITLRLAPFCVARDHHAVMRGSPDWHFRVEAIPDLACAYHIQADDIAPIVQVFAAPQAQFAAAGEWFWGVHHRAEQERGLVADEDVYLPGFFTAALAPGQTATLVFAASHANALTDTAPTPLPIYLTGLGGDDHEQLAAQALAHERARCAALLAQAGVAGNVAFDDWLAILTQRLTLAADQFVVARMAPSASLPVGGTQEVTVIAGYPWFTDWGRDTMIALPGLTLHTGRFAQARELLRGFVGYLDQGMIPNRFPDSGGGPPEYNTVDATLWLFHALGAYLDATGDQALLAELFDRLAESVGWYERGTRYGIGVDPADGLLRAGAAGAQLTWMDAKVGDWVVTPRRGKPVEINTLWHRALTLMGVWARQLNRDSAPYDRLRALVEANFLRRFWYAAGGYLADVVDVEGQSGAIDWSLRPNQVFALTLAQPLIPPEQARLVVSLVGRELLAPLGLRTLAPDDPRFIGVYSGDQHARDAAYHQGTVWPWLLGVYADARDAYPPTDDDGNAASGNGNWLAALLRPYYDHLFVAGLGTISEITWGALPFTPVGCIAQAWSVAEVLRLTRRASG
ncbi:MAG: amylo-alpha-1,6-glucosidase [Ktedonobacterales bacterium]